MTVAGVVLYKFGAIPLQKNPNSINRWSYTCLESDYPFSKVLPEMPLWYQNHIDNLRESSIKCRWPHTDRKVGEHREKAWRCPRDMSLWDADYLDLQSYTFKGVNFDGAVFFGCNLTGTEFIDCDLKSATFSECTLHHTVFKGCDLTDLAIDKCYMFKADFSESICKDINFMWGTYSNQVRYPVDVPAVPWIFVALYEIILARVAANQHRRTWRENGVVHTTLKALVLRRDGPEMTGLELADCAELRGKYGTKHGCLYKMLLANSANTFFRTPFVFERLGRYICQTLPELKRWAETFPCYD